MPAPPPLALYCALVHYLLSYRCTVVTAQSCLSSVVAVDGIAMPTDRRHQTVDTANSGVVCVQAIDVPCLTAAPVTLL